LIAHNKSIPENPIPSTGCTLQADYWVAGLLFGNHGLSGVPFWPFSEAQVAIASVRYREIASVVRDLVRLHAPVRRFLIDPNIL
jgi:hypothetical protein